MTAARVLCTKSHIVDCVQFQCLESVLHMSKAVYPSENSILGYEFPERVLIYDQEFHVTHVRNLKIRSRGKIVYPRKDVSTWSQTVIQWSCWRKNVMVTVCLIHCFNLAVSLHRLGDKTYYKIFDLGSRFETTSVFPTHTTCKVQIEYKEEFTAWYILIKTKMEKQKTVGDQSSSPCSQWFNLDPPPNLPANATKIFMFHHIYTQVVFRSVMQYQPGWTPDVVCPFFTSIPPGN